MKKILAIAASAAALLAFAPTAPAHATPSVYPTYNKGAYLSYEGMMDDCLKASLFLTTVETTMYSPDGAITASDHGEGSLEIRDTCHLSLPECDEDCDDNVPGPTLLLSASLEPSHGSSVATKTLASARYRENMKVSGQAVKRFQIAIDWTAVAPVERTNENEQDSEGWWVRAGASRKAKATFTVVAGEYTITGSTRKATIWQSLYAQL